MDLFTAYCEDRHIDPVIRVFSTEAAAVAFCKAFVKEVKPKAKLEEDALDGALYYARFSCEGDHVRVEKVTLDDASL